MKKLILPIALAIVIIVGMGGSQAAFATKLGDVFEAAEIPTYFIGGYQTERDAFRDMCYAITGSYYDCWGYETNYNLLFEKVFQPMAIRLFRSISSDRSYVVTDFLKASELFKFGNMIRLPCWGYNGVVRFDSLPWNLNLTDIYPELMAYNILGQPLNHAIPDLSLLSFFQAEIKAEIDYFGNPKSLVGLSSCPTSDAPVYGGLFLLRTAGGYNNQSLEKFVNSKYFDSVDNNGNITASLSPSPGAYFSDQIIMLGRDGPATGNYTLSIQVRDSNGNPVPNAFVMPLITAYFRNYRWTDTNGLISYITGGTQSFYAIADLGNKNFYYGTATVDVTGNQSLEIILDKPYGKSKLWEQFVQKSTTYPIAELARETYLFHFKYHSTYLPVANAELEKAIVDYARSYSGKNLLSRHSFDRATLSEVEGYPELPQYTTGYYGVTDVLNYGDEYIAWGNLYTPGDSGGGIGGGSFRVSTEDERYRYYLSGVPLFSNNQHTELDYVGYDSRFGGPMLLSPTLTSISYQFGEIMNRMRYVGGWSGYENPLVRVLIIANRALGIYLQYTPFAKVTWVRQYDSNLERADFLANYDVILVVDPDTSLPSSAAMTNIRQFVQGGKGLVYGGPGWWGGWDDQWNELFGVDFDRTGSTSGAGNLRVDNSNHSILRPYGTSILPEYDSGDSRWRPKIILSPATVSSIVSDSVKGPIVFENTYGAGRVLVLPTLGSGSNNIWGSYSWPYTMTPSSYQTLVINSLLYVSRKESQIPIIWHTNYKTRQDWDGTNMFYSITGKPNSPKLFWISNPSTTASPFAINLSAPGLGLGNDWVALDAKSMKIVAKANSPVISINVTVPALSWMPIYIFNTTDTYSNFIIKDTSQTSAQRRYTLEGPVRQPGWLVYSSQTKPLRFSVGGNILNECGNSDDLFSNTCWYYDGQNSVILASFQTPTNPPPCTGTLALDLSPNPTVSGSQVTPSASGNLSGCDGKTVSFRQNSCSGYSVSSCAVLGTGCNGSNFAAPSTSTTYSACLDMNDNFNYLDAGESDSEVLSVTPAPVSNSKLYSVLMTSPAVIVELNLPDLTVNRRMTTSGNVGHQVESNGTYLYAGMLSNPGKIVKVRLSDMTEVGSLTYNTGEGGIERMAIIDGSLYTNATGAPVIIKIDPVTMTRQATLTLSTGGGGTGFYYYNGYIYALSYDRSISTLMLLRIDPTTFTESAKISLDITGQRSVIALNGLLYILSNTNPTRVAIVDPDSFTVRQYVNLTGSGGADRWASNGRYLYMNNDASPGTATRFDPVTLDYKTITFGTGTRPFDVDIKDGFLYLSLYMTPGGIAKVDLNTFTWVETISLGTGNNSPTQAVIAP